MKKFAIVASVIATAFVLASCASKGTYDNGPVAAPAAPVAKTCHHHHCHHDYKGEMSK